MLDTKLLDRAVPLGYVVLVLAATMFYRDAVAPIAIFGALALAGYYSYLKPALRARREAELPDGGARNDGE